MRPAVAKTGRGNYISTRGFSRGKDDGEKLAFYTIGDYRQTSTTAYLPTVKTTPNFQSCEL